MTLNVYTESEITKYRGILQVWDADGYHETGGLCDAPKMQGKPRATSVHLRWNYPQYDGGAPVSDFEVQMVLSVFSGRDHSLSALV